MLIPRILILALSVLWLSGASVSAEECNLTGNWSSSFGRLELKQDGSKVTGKYTKESENFFERVTGTIEGTLLDGKMQWIWSQSDKEAGHGQWTVSPGCRSLDGKWGRTKNLELGNWFATRAR